MAVLPSNSLNERQKQMLELIAIGLKDTEIAKEMQLSLSSVHNEVRMLLTKLNEQNRTGLVTISFCYGILCPKAILEKKLHYEEK